MQNLLTTLKTVLATDKRLVVHGQLAKNNIIELALNLDKTLLSLLLQSPPLKKHFFTDVDGIQVFDKVKFQSFVSNKQFLPDSFTAFKNKIGLTANRHYLTESREVVLSWPYKDCVLEGGQTKDEQKRQEIFWNQTLAPDEIDRLLAPKVFANFKCYDRDGVHEVNRLTIDDNLIIKGNNLLALHSLKKRYAGKVKLIYIDPPYNKGGNADTFDYNNKFKHSTWLTFMKNRLEVAKNLLRDDGVIIIAIDGTEQCYLGVLIDELFPEYENHCVTIVHNPRGVQGTNFSYNHEYAFFVIPKGRKIISNRNLDEKNITWSNFRNWGSESSRHDAKNCFYPIIVENEKVVEFGNILSDHQHPEKQTIKINNKYYVYPIDRQSVERKWRYARQSVESIKHLLRAKKTKRGYEIEIGKNFSMYRTVWIDNRYDANEYGTKLIKSLAPDCKFSFPKSFYNVYDCIHAVVANDKNAIILDYHAGSGTTAHAVLALNKEDGGNRKYILCEQMDYIQDVTIARVQAVLKKENINSSFTYCELTQHNANIIDQIEKAKDSKQLQTIWKNIQDQAFISYQVKPKIINNNIDDFKSLNLTEQKRLLIEILDKNQLYINYSEIDDQQYKLSEQDKKLTKQFYGEDVS